MGAKRALIVDDSKSARLFLSRILEQHAIDVESVESAEAAIEYLSSHRPDVIFMDHLMPGMDGFQAVKAIKNNPLTATIPIMMYTSQEGELYLGQARALGAVGVLPKQIKQADVSRVLYELHLLPERRRKPEGAGTVTLDALAEAVAAGQEAADAHVAAAEAAAGAIANGRAEPDSGLRDQLNELRRALVASIETQSDHIISDFHALFRESPLSVPAEPPPRRQLGWAWTIAALGLAIALSTGALWWREARLTQALSIQLAESRDTQRDSEQRLALALQAANAAAVDSAAQNDSLPAASTQTTALAPTDAPAASGAAGDGPSPARIRRLNSNAGEKPVVVPVPYGEDALAGTRLENIRQLFQRLIAQQFHGTVDIRSFPGRFCLTGNATDGFSLAPDDLPYARCDIVGNPREDAQDISGREPLAFANLINELRTATGGAANVRVSAGDPQATVLPYPAMSTTLTAGEWNRAASVNNRVEIRMR